MSAILQVPSPAASAAQAPVSCRGERLNDLARERLAAGFDLYAECSVGAQEAAAPKWVRFRLSGSGLERLLHLRTLCVEQGLDHAQVIATPHQYDQVSPPINSWRVRVDLRQFWLVGLRFDGQHDVEAVPVPFDVLETVLNAASNDQHAPFATCRWYGGAIVCDDPFSAITNFTEILTAACPELGARQRELEMAARLAEHPAANSHLPGSAPARRAARL